MMFSRVNPWWNGELIRGLCTTITVKTDLRHNNSPSVYNIVLSKQSMHCLWIPAQPEIPIDSPTMSGSRPKLMPVIDGTNYWCAFGKPALICHDFAMKRDEIILQAREISYSHFRVRSHERIMNFIWQMLPRLSIGQLNAWKPII